MTTLVSSELEHVVDLLRRGGPVVLTWGERSLLVAPAALATPDLLADIERRTSAPASLALDAATFDALGLGISEPFPAQESPVGLPVDVGVSGIDAMGRGPRAATMAQIGQGDVDGIRTPGQVPTVRSSPGNLLSRIGPIEAAVDLVELAGFRPAAVTAFLVDGTDVSDLAVVDVPDVRTAALEAAGGAQEGDVTSLFIGAMSRLVAPVAVITTSPDGVEAQGLVVSSLTSYSSSPPSVVFSVALTSRNYATLHSTQRFGVHILASGQDDLVKAFASKSSDKFAGLEWEMQQGVPVLPGVQTMLHCRKIGELRLGDHALFVGAILDGDASDREPMVYFDRKFDWEMQSR